MMAVMIAFGEFSSPAQAAELPETEGAFFALSVQNIDEMAAWYVNHLGFKIDSQGGNDERKGALLSRPGAVLELAQFVEGVEIFFPTMKSSDDKRTFGIKDLEGNIVHFSGIEHGHSWNSLCPECNK